MRSPYRCKSTPSQFTFAAPSPALASERDGEAPGGFEPPHKGFADLSLTTWVRRQKKDPVAWWEFVATGQVHRGSDSGIQIA